jgi:dolichyl-phosphate beta-glucosyltransferase
MYLSVVIPAYNEEKRIGKTLSKTNGYLKKQGYDFEIIVIDDGSDDKTVDLSRTYSNEITNLVVIENKNNQGKGYSVREGVLNSRGEIILFADADFSTPIEEIDKLLHWLNNGYQIAIGSRAMPGSQIMVYQAWYRQLMGKSFNKVIQLILGLDYYDTQCGFKCFQRTVAMEVFNPLKSRRFSFDVEVLYISKLMGYRVKEVPICWYNSAGSKVRLIQDSLKMFLDVLQIRLSCGKPGKQD